MVPFAPHSFVLLLLYILHLSLSIICPSAQILIIVSCSCLLNQMAEKPSYKQNIHQHCFVFIFTKQLSLLVFFISSCRLNTLSSVLHYSLKVCLSILLGGSATNKFPPCCLPQKVFNSPSVFEDSFGGFRIPGG